MDCTLWFRLKSVVYLFKLIEWNEKWREPHQHLLVWAFQVTPHCHHNSKFDISFPCGPLEILQGLPTFIRTIFHWRTWNYFWRILIFIFTRKHWYMEALDMRVDHVKWHSFFGKRGGCGVCWGFMYFNVWFEQQFFREIIQSLAGDEARFV